jgi:adenine-specific DNA-methyltransferase
VVGGQSQDLSRHDKWLSMIYPRLKLLKNLLSEDGVIFISIDDNEHSNLKLIMDEIFGEQNFLSSFIWRKKEGGGQAVSYFSVEHEYILVYKKSDEFSWNDEIIFDDQSNYTNSDEGGKYNLTKLAKWGNTARRQDRPGMYYSIKAPDNTDVYPLAPDGNDGRWRVGKVRMEELLKSNLVEWKKKKDNTWIPYEKVYFQEGKQKAIKARSILYDIANTADASKSLTEIFNEKDRFDTPKPVELLKFLFKHTTDENSIILDSFAGSGTTGHAVLDLNKEDGINRQFIMIEMEDHVAKEITAERVKRAIKKYDYKDGFEYCELSKPLFDEEGQIDDECDFNQLANYIFFTETQANIDLKGIKGSKIGEFGSIEYYLLFREKDKNILNHQFLKTLKKDGITKIVYADQCMVDDDILEQYNIIFKQIPYEIRVY